MWHATLCQQTACRGQAALPMLPRPPILPELVPACATMQRARRPTKMRSRSRQLAGEDRTLAYHVPVPAPPTALVARGHPHRSLCTQLLLVAPVMAGTGWTV